MIQVLPFTGLRGNKYAAGSHLRHELKQEFGRCHCDAAQAAAVPAPLLSPWQHSPAYCELQLLPPLSGKTTSVNQVYMELSVKASGALL